MEMQEIEAKPRPRERVQFLNGAKQFARSVGMEIDAAVEQRVLRLPDDEFAAMQTQTVAGLLPILNGDARPAVPDYGVQVENFKLAAASKGALYFVWPDEALTALRRKLDSLGPNCELHYLYAMSAMIKLPSGKLLLVDRRGETKG
jgi:hypothetical protein